MRRAYDVRLYQQVPVNEIRRILVVGVDTTHLRRCQVNLIDPVFPEEVGYALLRFEIEILAVRDQ